MAVTGRFIRSDIGGGFNSNSTLKPANTFAVDVSGYYMSPKHESLSGYEGRVKAGWAVQNLGPRLDYTGDEESRSYLPTMARLGLGYDLLIDDMNRFSLSGEASKILVPGPDATGNVPNVGVMEGIGKSFSNKKVSCIVVLQSILMMKLLQSELVILQKRLNRVRDNTQLLVLASNMLHSD
jgi:hypothetical protein